MKRVLFFLFFFPLFLFSGVFEHLLNKDINYLFKHNFRCDNSICITREKNIFYNDTMDDLVKVVKVFLDNTNKVFKIEIELYFHDEKKEAFYEAVIKSSDKNKKMDYLSYDKNDKYGNHSFVNIIDKKRRKMYVEFLTEKYYTTMKSYKN